MKERQKRLNQIAEKFELDIIYAFGSKANEVAEWVQKKGFELSISGSSDVDVGVKPCSGRRLSAKEKVHLSMTLQDLLSLLFSRRFTQMSTDRFKYKEIKDY